MFKTGEVENMNKKLVSCLALLMCISAVSLNSGRTDEVSINGLSADKYLNITDLIALKSKLNGESYTDDSDDLNNDGIVNYKDAVMLSDFLVGKISQLPERTTVEYHQKTVTSVTASDDVCVRGDGSLDTEEGIINVAGFNAAKRRNVYIKFKADELDIKDVKKAEVQLRLDRTSNGNCEVKLAACSSGWNESDPPGYESVPSNYGLCDVVVTKHEKDVGSVISFDVTDVVRENPDASEFNFVLYCDHDNNSDAVSNLALFNSRESQNPPKLVVESGGEQPDNASALSADESYVRFESPTNHGSFMRVSDGKLIKSRNVSPLSDARFLEKTGFMGNDTVSLESQSEPGYYLCRKYGGSEIVLMKDDGTAEFRKNASFIKTKGLEEGTSYQAYGLPGRYLSNLYNEFFISNVSSDTRKSHASFLVRSEKNVILDDEFDGNSLNTDVWAYSYPWADHHNYSAVVRKSQVEVKNGKLVLTAKRVADDDWIKDDKGETGYTDNIGEKKWRKYSHITGVVHLPFSKYPLSGNLYMEGRFKMPDKSGFWPAFWLNGNNSWPPEIDIFEYLSNTPEKIYVGIHRQDSSRENGDGGAGWWIDRSASFFQQEFHTYALDWGDTYINYYIDDILVKSIEDQAYINNQKNMYLILNLGVGGWAEEPTDNVGDETTYECDYIRIYGY